MEEKIIEILQDCKNGISVEICKDALLTLTDVSQQRGTLRAYAELIQNSYTNHFFDDAVEESIDEFLNL